MAAVQLRAAPDFEPRVAVSQVRYHFACGSKPVSFNPLGFELGENRFRCARGSLSCMKTFTAVVERSPETGLFVGFIPGFPGAHTQAESLDELNANLREVLAMLLEDGEPHIEAEFIGTQLVQVG